LYEEVNQLEITAPGEAPRKLTREQRDDLILELRHRKERSFAALAKRLKLQPGESFNKASETRTHLRGNEVYAALVDEKRFGKAGWAHRSPEQQWRVIERLADEENPETLHAFLLEEGLDDEHARAAAKAPLPEGHGRLGETATRLILEELKKDVVTYDEAVRRAGWHHSDDRTGEILDRLPYYGELLTRDIPPGSQLASDPPEKRWGKITNPTVHIGLRQLEKLVNGVIARHGRPDQIVFELARELNLSDDDKKKHEARILLQKIAHAAARAEDKDLDRLFEDLAQPWTGFREELREKLGNVVASHKPDHGRKGAPSRHRDVTAGRLHNDTAYGLTGETAADGRTPIVVHRVPLASLKPADLTNPDRIPDPILRAELHREAGGLEGRDFLAALERVRKEGIRGRVDRNGRPLFKGLRHVRVREPLNVIPVRDAAGRAYKAYKGDANARLDVWQLPAGKWVTSWKDRDGVEQSGIVSMFDAHQSEVQPRPHPAAKKVLSLRQNDLIAIECDGGPREIVRVVKFSTNGAIALAPANEGGPLKARDADKGDPFRYIYSSAGGLKKLEARQIRIDPLGRILDPGPR